MKVCGQFERARDPLGVTVLIFVYLAYGSWADFWQGKR